MNQSMAVAYATLGSEFLALMLRVVMVRTVVTPMERKPEKRQLVRATGAAPPLSRQQHLSGKPGVLPWATWPCTPWGAMRVAKRAAGCHGHSPIGGINEAVPNCIISTVGQEAGHAIVGSKAK